MGSIVFGSGAQRAAGEEERNACHRQAPMREAKDRRAYWPAMILTGAPSSVNGNATTEPTPPAAAVSLKSVA